MDLMITGNPITKKNSMRIVSVRGRAVPIPSKAFIDYQTHAKRELYEQWDGDMIDCAVEVTVIYYMASRRRVDLTNLLEATDDILVHAGILFDDNSTIIYSHDGSRVKYDKENPRCEIEIKKVEIGYAPFNEYIGEQYAKNKRAGGKKLPQGLRNTHK